MKTIVIATDFSGASNNAALYGVQFAKALNAHVVLFNAYQMPPPPAGINLSISQYDIMKITEQKLKDEADKISSIHKQYVKIICEEGDAYDAIIKIADELKADFIIVGMKGIGKNLKKILGSTATKLSRNVHVPLIIVPEEARFLIPKKILYTSDKSLDTNIFSIDQLKSITEIFNPKLYVIRVVEDEYKEIFEAVHIPNQLRKELVKLNTTFHFPINADINNSIAEFILQHQIDILIMKPHKHDWIQRIFKKSKTESMIFHTLIPILILPDFTD